MDRRKFLALGGLGVAAAAIPGCKTVAGAGQPGGPGTPDTPPPVKLTAPAGPVRKGRIFPADYKLNIACVGCGGKGGGDVGAVSGENIVALCDVDWDRAKGTFNRFPDAKPYRDFRHMLLEMDEQIDAVTVSTPDHTHFPAAMMAMSMGKHVFVQKPLAHTVEEARLMTLAARRHEVMTVMGNQGHANEGTRLVKEWIQQGAIGDVREIHVWTNRPIWPQGIDRPTEKQVVPDMLDWNRWLGVAPTRPYHSAYLPFNWRGWWDFGCGALGDMGCHMLDAPWWALDLGQPTSIEARSTDLKNESAPTGCVVTYQFPARGKLPPLKLVWYEGKETPPRAKDLEEDRKMPRTGQYIVGEKGTILDGSDYCSSPRIVPEARMKEVGKPEQTIPRVPNGNHYQEWINSCKGGPKAGSNFDHAGPMTEMVLLGNIAIRAGKRIEWDSEKLCCTNAPEANAYVRKAYRKF